MSGRGMRVSASARGRVRRGGTSVALAARLADGASPRRNPPRDARPHGQLFEEAPALTGNGELEPEASSDEEGVVVPAGVVGVDRREPFEEDRRSEL